MKWFSTRLFRIIATALLIGVSAALAARLDLDKDVARLLPDADARLTRATAVMRRMLERSVIDIAAPPGHPMSVEELGNAADRFAAALRASGSVASVNASLEVAEAWPIVEFLRSRAPRLLEGDDLREIERRIQPAAVQAAISRLARRLQEPDGAHLAANAATDPLGLADLALEPLATLTAGFRGAKLVRGRILSADGQHLLVLAEPGFPATDTARTERLMKSIEDAAGILRDDPSSAAVVVRHLGTHRSTLDNAVQIEDDVKKTSLIGVLLIGTVVLLTFRTLWLAVLSLTPAIFGATVTLGVFSLFRDSLPALVAGFGAVLLGLTIDYAIHVLFRLDQGKRNTRLPFVPLVMSATTTIAALLSLRASALPVIRDIGAFGVAGIAGAAFFTIFALPAIAGRPDPTRSSMVNLGALFRWLRSRRVAVTVLVATIVLTPVVAAGVLRLVFEGDVSRLSSLSPHAREDEEVITETWGEAFRLSTVIVEGKTPEEVLRANDRVAAVLDDLTREGAIREHASFSGLLPSLATQETRLRAWRSFWSPERQADLRALVEVGVEGTPFRPDAFEPFFAWLATDPAPVLAKEFETGARGRLLEGRLIRSGDFYLASTPVFTDQWRQVETLRMRLERELPSASLLNREALVRELSGMVGGEMVKLGGIAFLAVLVLVFLWLGRIELTLVIVLPLIISLLWTLGILGWLGVPISLTNAIFVAFLFGAAVDYAIFIASSRLDRFRTGSDHTFESDAAVLLCGATTGIGFGVLSTAGHPVLFSIGVTGMVGILCATAVTLILVPAFSRALLVFPGPSGTPGVRNMAVAAWVFVLMVEKALAFLLFRSWRLKPEARQRAAIETIHRMSVTIRHHLPIGRRIYIGDEPERFAKPAIIVANHESMYDIMGLLALPVPIQILIKQWVWKTPVMGWMARQAGYTLVRETSIEEIVAEARMAVARGISILTFPEGTRSRDGRIARFHNGAFALARALDVNVIPVAMVNTGTVVRRNTWWVGYHDVRIAVLEPLAPADFHGEGADRRMARAARDRIREARDRLWPETQMGPEWHQPIAGMYRYLGPVVGHYAASKLKRDPLVRALPELGVGSGNMLVAGCGLGIMTARLALAFPRRRLCGVDSDARKVAVARAALGERPGLSWRVGDLLDPALDLEPADLVVLADVLHYWPEETQRQILVRVASVLAPGGRLVFRDACSDGSPGHAVVATGERLAALVGFTRSPGKFCFRSRDGWRTLLGECGLVVERCDPELTLLSNTVFLCRKERPPPVAET